MSGQRITKLLLAILLLGVLTVPTTAIKQGAHLQYVTSIYTDTYRNIIYNDTLFLQEGNTIKVYNVTHGQNFINMKYIDYTNEIKYYASGFKAANNILYVVTGSKLVLFSLADKLHPVEIGNVSSNGLDLVVNSSSHTVFALTGGTIVAYDVSIPSSIVKLGESADSGIPCIKLAYDGHYAYGSYYDAGTSRDGYFCTWDVSNPYNIVFLGTTYTGTNSLGTYGIDYYNNTLYVANANHNFQAWNVTNRSAPAKIYESGAAGSGSGDTIGAMSLQVYDHYLFVDARYNFWGADYGLGNGGIVVFDISNHTPVELSADGSSTGYTEGLSTDGITAVESSQTVGFTLYDVTNKNSIYKLTHISSLATPWALSPHQMGSMEVLAVTGRDGGAWFFNITNPMDFSSAKYLNAWDYHMFARMTFFDWYNNYTFPFLGSNGQGSWIVNLTGIDQPAFVVQEGQSFFPGENLGALVVNETRLWLSTGGGGDAPYEVFNFTLKDAVSPPLIVASYKFDHYIDPTPMVLKGHRYMVNPATDGNGYTEWQFWGNVSQDDPATWTLDYTWDTGMPLTGACGDFQTGYYYGLSGGNSWKALYRANLTTFGNYFWEPGYVPDNQLYISLPGCTENGTDVFVMGNDIAADYYGSIAMVDFQNISAPRVVDWASVYNGEHLSDGGDRGVYYKGYLYTGGGKISVWKVLPSTSTPPKLQQTIGSQNQPSEQQSNSSVDDQNIIKQIAGMWKSFVNYLIRHFPIQI